MRHRSGTGLLILALGIALAACDTVSIQYAVGEPASDEVGKQLEGWWTHGDGALAVKYLTEGSLRIATVEWEKGKFQLRESTALLTTYENSLYLNLRPPESQPETPPEYLWFRLMRRGDGVVLLWAPRGDSFTNAVRRGELAGEAVKEDLWTTVRLAASKAELEAFLKSRNPGDLFKLEEPLVFIRQTAK
jgi:hypothetical protein